MAYSCVRNVSRLSVGVVGLCRCSRAVHGAVKKGHLQLARAAWARALPGLLAPHLRLVTGAVHRALSGPPGRAEPQLPDPDEGDAGFGSLSSPWSSRRSYRKTSPEMEELRYPELEEEGEGLVRRKRRRINTPYWYFLQCKKLIKENKLQAALDLFSSDMLLEERLQPEEFNYSVLIGGCGRAGQLKKAFRLYNDMKKRGLEPSDATYTALFNACAECPSKSSGLSHALKLEQEVKKKNYFLSTITYHALMKAHATTNHLQAVLHTLREMLQNGHVATQETFHYLLMGCVKDRDTGFRLALQIWRQMLKSNILPDSKNYTLLLRSARDCGIGDPAVASTVLLKPLEDLKNPVQISNTIDIDVLEKQLFIQPLSKNIKSSNEKEKALIQVADNHAKFPPANMQQKSSSPNLLDVFEGRSNGVMSICAVDGAKDRLALIGGALGFLKSMEVRGLRADLKTLTLLADTAEPSRENFNMFLKIAKQNQVKLDAAFFNSVIRRAARAGDKDMTQLVLSVMRQRHVSVDVQTFGSLALGCEREKEALLLLNNMEEAGLRPNVHVFSALIGRAARRLDYVYLKKLLILMKEKEVWPNEVIIKQLEFASQYPPNYNQYKSRNNYLIHIDGFRGYYQQWLRSMPAQTDAQTDAQTQTDSQTQTDKQMQTDSQTDRQTGAQWNQQAAARRYNSKRKQTNSSTTAL